MAGHERRQGGGRYDGAFRDGLVGGEEDLEHSGCDTFGVENMYVVKAE